MSVLKECNLELSKHNQLKIAFYIFLNGPQLSSDRNFPLIIRNILGENKNKFKSELSKVLTMEKSNRNDKVPWKAKHTILGIYFRQLYQLYEFIDQNEYISEKSKYKFGKIIRSCLTIQQQAILALDIWTGFGCAWEQSLFLQKYNPIKNIPENYLKSLTGLKMNEMFPQINFEFQGNSIIVSEEE